MKSKILILTLGLLTFNLVSANLENDMEAGSIDREAQAEAADPANQEDQTESTEKNLADFFDICIPAQERLLRIGELKIKILYLDKMIEAWNGLGEEVAYSCSWHWLFAAHAEHLGDNEPKEVAPSLGYVQNKCGESLTKIKTQLEDFRNAKEALAEKLKRLEKIEKKYQKNPVKDCFVKPPLVETLNKVGKFMSDALNEPLIPQDESEKSENLENVTA